MKKMFSKKKYGFDILSSDDYSYMELTLGRFISNQSSLAMNMLSKFFSSQGI